MNFVNLNEEDSLINVTENSTLLTKPKVTIQLLSEEEISQVEYIPKTEVDTQLPSEETIPQVKYTPKTEVDTQVLSDEEIPQLEYIPKTEVEKDTMDLQSSCGIEQYYPDASKEDYFKRENLFSELVNDYQRAKARYNLGIGEEYSLV